jgi:hypothetical protein
MAKIILKEKKITKITIHNSDALRPDPSAGHTLIKVYDLQELWE